MKRVLRENKQFLFAFFGTLLLILSCSIFVSNSEMQVEQLAIKSITPIYEEDSGVIVTEENGIIFNDKDQEVKYNIVVENVLDYDVKFNHVELSNPSEDFLEYEIVGIDTDDVIKTGETKEIEVVLNTVSKEGWGRNFNDELYARVVFDKGESVDEPVTPDEPGDDGVEVPEIGGESSNEGTGTVVPGDETDNKSENNNSGIVDNGSNVETVTPNNNVTNKEEVQSKPEINEEVKDEEIVEEVEKDDVSHEMLESPSSDTSSIADKTVIYFFGFASGVAGVGFIMLSKNKLSKYIMFVVVLGTPLLIKADTIAHLPITLKVSFESQNVMKPSGCQMNVSTNEILNCSDYLQYSPNIKNVYIQNEINKINDWKYRFDISNKQDGRVIATLVVNDENNSYYDLYIQADGIIYTNEDASGYFANMYILDKVDNLEGLDTSKATNMSYMFGYAGKDSKLFTLDVSTFDTSKVTDMRNMFRDAGYSNPEFTLDVSDFDTSNVTDMSSMFYKTGFNSSIFTLDVSNFNTENVTDMSSMFYKTGFSSKNFMLDVSGFDTSNVTNMYYMFNAAGYSSLIFTLDVSNFNMDKVTDTSGMFRDAGYYSSQLNSSITISNPNNTVYSKMFENIAIQPGSQIIVNYTGATSDLVDQMIATKSPNSNVIKGKLIVNVDNLSIGDEIYIENEKFNVISLNADSITLLAKYNLGVDYKQSTTQNSVKFTNDRGWVYEPGPKEIDIQAYDGSAKTYVNGYAQYLNEYLDVSVNLITMTELKQLGCFINDDYSLVNSGVTCQNSSYKSWLLNGQSWWTHSAYAANKSLVWTVLANGELDNDHYDNSHGIRPVIRVSKETLKKYLD